MDFDGKEELLLLLSKKLVTRAYVLVFRTSDGVKPVQTFATDLRFGKDDIEKQRFVIRLLTQEGLNEKSRELGLGSVNVVIGYSQRSPTGTLVNFVESIMTNQWEIALQKVLEIESSPRLYLTIKVIETDTAHSLSRPNIAKNTDFKETSQDPTATVANKESNNKGKRKRKREEMKEDELLWEKRLEGEGVNRNKRQQQRLQQWKETVAKTRLPGNK